MSFISPIATDVNGNEKATGSMQILGKDDFLKLLVTKLQNQDPLDPMADEDFIAQLAQFTTTSPSTMDTCDANEMIKSSGFGAEPNCPSPTDITAGSAQASVASVASRHANPANRRPKFLSMAKTPNLQVSPTTIGIV